MWQVVRAMYWMLAGMRALHHGTEAQVQEAMTSLWVLADDLENKELQDD